MVKSPESANIPHSQVFFPRMVHQTLQLVHLVQRLIET